MNSTSLTPLEVAELLKITKNTVYELIKRGELPAYKVGRKLRIDKEDIDNYIILSGYRKYYVNSEHSEKLIEAHSAEEYKEKVFIKFSDIKRIEKLERKRAEKDIYSC